MTIPVRYPVLELVVGIGFGFVGLVARPLYVPVLLAVVASVVAAVEAWRLHRRSALRLVAASAALVALSCVVTLAVWWVGR